MGITSALGYDATFQGAISARAPGGSPGRGPGGQPAVALKRLWFYRRPAWAEKAWKQWCEQARLGRIPALELFAKRLQSYWHGILARCRYPLNISGVEGINSTIKVVKRRAYGYRDEEYFYLKIRAAFPEFLDEPNGMVTPTLRAGCRGVFLSGEAIMHDATLVGIDLGKHSFHLRPRPARQGRVSKEDGAHTVDRVLRCVPRMHGGHGGLRRGASHGPQARQVEASCGATALPFSLLNRLSFTLTLPPPDRVNRNQITRQLC